MRCPLDHILTYYDGLQHQYTHLRASMLAYAHINLLSMLTRLRSKEVPRVAVDSIYVQKTALYKLKGVETLLQMSIRSRLKRSPRPNGVTKASGYTCPRNTQPTSKPEYTRQQKDMPDSTAPRFDDPLTRYQLSYLNGGGGSGKTTRAVELFRQRDTLVFTPTHRLAKEMRTRGVKAQTYHIFFRWSGKTEWTPERMGQKFIPRVIIWDQICTMTQPILETFLDCLEHRGVQVVCCGD